MRRKFLGIPIILATLFMLFAAVPAGAHTVTVGDLSRTDWFAKGPPEANVGAIARDASGRGEYVWTDAKGDQRVANTIGATGDITREADLTRFSVTADATNIYFLTKVEHYSGIRNNPALQVMVSVDRDRTGGQTALPDGVSTNVASAAAWEYVVQSRFVPANSSTPAGQYYVNAQPWVYSTPTVTTTVGSGQLVSASASGGSYAEMSVPWSAIGGKPASPQDYVRFTVSTYYSDHRAPNDFASKAIDTLSPGSTSTELSNGTIDNYVDLYFNAAGEVFAPLLISEFLPDPIASSDPDGEWIEIYNPNSFNISLDGYKIGDQAYRGGSQGMLQLPATQTLTASTALVIANNVAKFKLAFPNVPPSKIIEMKNLAPYTSWGTGNVTLQNKNDGLPFKESIALLDPRDTIVDLVQYAYKTDAGPTGLDPDVKPILLQGPTVEPNASYDRCPSGSDTNDGGLDFFVRTSGQTPGVACATVPGVDLRISKEGPESINQNAASPTITYVIPFVNAGSTPASNVVITDTLPAQVTFATQSSTVANTTFSQNGQTLTWNIASLPSQASGTITVKVNVSGGLNSGTEIINNAGITSTPAEADTTLHNNFATQTVIVAASEPDLTVFSTWAGANGTLPGKQFSFTIGYENFGQNDATDITIIDTLPANVSFVSAEPAPKTVSGKTVIWKIPSLAFNNPGAIRVTVQLAAGAMPGSMPENVIDISGNPPDVDSATERPDRERASFQVGTNLRKLFIPMARRS